jgi:tellurite methyltransferase
MDQPNRNTATAHLDWDKRWQEEGGRADWLSPEPDVESVARDLLARGARKALDLGCGVGRHALYLASQGFEVRALDGSRAGLDHASQEAKAAGLAIDFRLCSMMDIDYPDESFDYVLAWNVIYHGDEPVVRHCIDQIRRVLKPGGLYQGTMLSKRNRLYNQGIEVAANTFVSDTSDLARIIHEENHGKFMYNNFINKLSWLPADLRHPNYRVYLLFQGNSHGFLHQRRCHLPPLALSSGVRSINIRLHPGFLARDET